MTKKELIKTIESADDYACIVVGDKKTGWSNIGEVKYDGVCIHIMEDFSRPFSSDN